MELAEVLADVSVDVAADITGRTELFVELTGGMELEARVKIQQLKELEVLLIAVCCWDSLKS